MINTAKKSLKMILASFLAVIFFFGSYASAVTVRATDTTKAGTGKLLVGVRGDYEKADTAALLKRINEIRYEACIEGIYSTGLGRALTKSDYVAITWDSSLEYIAQLRAAEADVYMSHTRPDYTSTFTLSYNGKSSCSEVIAWNYSLLRGIEAWYSEKDLYIQDPTSTTNNIGHYASMINPNYKSIGLGGFSSSQTASTYELGCYVGEFGRETGDGKALGTSGDYIQKMEIDAGTVTSLSLSGVTALKIGGTSRLKATSNLSFSGVWPTTTTGAIVYHGLKWKTSNSKVAKVDSTGLVTGVGAGTATITATIGSYSKSVTVTVGNDTIIKTTYKGVTGWWYVKNGNVDATYTGFASNESGWWYVENGRVTFSKSDIIKGKVNGTTAYWYVSASQVIFTDTIAKKSSGGWWRIKNGKVDFTCNTVEKNDKGWYKLLNGKVDFSFTGIGENIYGKWYCKNGQVNFSFTGKVTYKGVTYNVVNGKVQ